MTEQLGILQLNTTDVGGGAEQVARMLAGAYRDAGHRSVLAVGRKRSIDDWVVELPNAAFESTPWSRAWRRRSDDLKEGGKYRKARLARTLAQPLTAYDLLRGAEDMRHPGTRELERLVPARPSIVQAHNLHGGWFDLRCLPRLSRAAPLVLTLHDAWLFTGHCAHSLECTRWETGCGSCPHLDVYPALHRDGTAANWTRKRAIYATLTARAVAPSQWLIDRVEKSVLAPSLLESRVIPNGVDLDLFAPGDRDTARARFGLAASDHVVLFVARGITASPWRDWPTLFTALKSLGARRSARTVFLGIGEGAPEETIGSVELRFIADLDRSSLADAYRAADISSTPRTSTRSPERSLRRLRRACPWSRRGWAGSLSRSRTTSLAGSSRREIRSPLQARLSGFSTTRRRAARRDGPPRGRRRAVRRARTGCRVPRVVRGASGHMKVVAVFPEATPYRTPLFDLIATRPEIDLVVVYASQTVMGRTWKGQFLQGGRVLRGPRVPGARRLLRHDYPITPGILGVLHASTRTACSYLGGARSHRRQRSSGAAPAASLTCWSARATIGIRAVRGGGS